MDITGIKILTVISMQSSEIELFGNQRSRTYIGRRGVPCNAHIFSLPKYRCLNWNTYGCKFFGTYSTSSKYLILTNRRLSAIPRFQKLRVGDAQIYQHCSDERSLWCWPRFGFKYSISLIARKQNGNNLSLCSECGKSGRQTIPAKTAATCRTLFNEIGRRTKLRVLQ